MRQHEMTADADLPYWMKIEEGIQPYPKGSAPLNPKNDKRRCSAEVKEVKVKINDSDN
jgi:hypothetical protein